MLTAFVAGLRRTIAAPAVLVVTYAITLAATVVLALVIGDGLERHLGVSPTSVIGFPAPLDNVIALLNLSPRPATVMMAVVVDGVLWAFLWGGILDHYARERATGLHGFFAACGVFFFRFLRLGLVTGVLYWMLFGPVHDGLFETLYPQLERTVTSGRAAFAWRAVLYGVLGTALVLIHVVVDYAKIRAVVEDRLSMIGAFLAGARFVWRHPANAIALYLLNRVLFLAVAVVYAILAGAGGRFGFLSAIVVGQVLLLARMWVRLNLAASQTCLFQSQLAHTGPPAARVPIWPESPAAETIVNAAGRRQSAVDGK